MFKLFRSRFFLIIWESVCEYLLKLTKWRIYWTIFSFKFLKNFSDHQKSKWGVISLFEKLKYLWSPISLHFFRFKLYFVPFHFKDDGVCQRPNRWIEFNYFKIQNSMFFNSFFVIAIMTKLQWFCCFFKCIRFLARGIQTIWSKEILAVHRAVIYYGTKLALD